MCNFEARRQVRRLAQPKSQEHCSTRHPTATSPTATASSPEAKQPTTRNSDLSVAAAKLPTAAAAKLQRGDSLARLQSTLPDGDNFTLSEARHRIHGNLEHLEEAPRRSSRNDETAAGFQRRGVVASSTRVAVIEIHFNYQPAAAGDSEAALESAGPFRRQSQQLPVAAAATEQVELSERDDAAQPGARTAPSCADESRCTADFATEKSPADARATAKLPAAAAATISVEKLRA